VGSDFWGDISLKKAEETIGKPIYWQIANDAKAMIGSRNEGKPLIEHSPRSKAQQGISGLAVALGNKNEKPAAPAPSGGGGWFSRK